MRNLYKYTKLYSNAEPILSEGDVFEIRIPLKKSVVGTEKSVIQTKKITLEQLLEECKRRSYNITVVNNLKKIHSFINTDQIFGMSDIESLLGCARSTAIALMKRLREMDVVVAVQGKGKGKYRLKYETEMKE